MDALQIIMRLDVLGEILSSNYAARVESKLKEPAVFDASNFKQLEPPHRWNIRKSGESLFVCKGMHDKQEDCEEVEYVPKALALRGEPVANGGTPRTDALKFDVVIDGKHDNDARISLEVVKATDCAKIEADLIALYAAPISGEPIRRFATAILHGDAAHRDWLMAAAEAFISGKNIPAATAAVSGERVREAQPISEVSIQMTEVVTTPCQGCGKRPIDFISGAALPLAAQPEGKPVRHERWCAIRMWDPLSGKPCPDCNCAAQPEGKQK